jgi:transcription antitermination factor NusG
VKRRTIRGRKVVATPLLFPGYAFVFIALQWHQARWAPVRLVMDGVAPAVVPDAVVVALRAREVDGLIELPVPPRFQRGDRVRIRHGAFVDRIGLVAGMKPHERVEVLLSILGGHQRVTLPVGAHVDDEPPVAV